MTRESDATSVWPVYDRLRSARLSVKYYGRRLHSVERLNFSLELVLLIAAPSSAIAGLWFWHTPAGHVAWQSFGVVAAIAAVLKPLLHLPKRIKEYEAVLSGYRVLEYDLLEIKDAIEQRKRFDAPLQLEYRKARAREKALIGHTPEAVENSRVKAVCEEEVNRELPAEVFYVPA